MRNAWLYAIASSLIIGTGELRADSEWKSALRRQIVAIDQKTPGNLGVYIKNARDNSVLSYNLTKRWYLSSTIKVPVAIVFLQKVEDGALSLDQEVVLKASDYVDGSGDTIWLKPGARLKVRDLLERMLIQSDSTATDILIGLIGVDELNHQIKTRVAPSGFGNITTLLQVRRDVYGEFHPKGRELSNMDFIELKKLEPEQRLSALASKLGVNRNDLRFQTLQQGYESYYRKGLNSADLASYGRMLERLADGQLLNAEHTHWVLDRMEKVTTGEKRIKAGLRLGLRFAQKTGTQQGRICNMGVIRSATRTRLVIAACLEKFQEPAQAEQALEKLGRALSESNALRRD